MLNDLLVTRLPNGVTNRNVNDIFSSMGQLDPTKFHNYMEDFDYYVAADWTVTETDAGATQALADGDGGLLLLTNTAAENDLLAMQKVGESFLLESGKKLFFKARFAVSEAVEMDWLFGLQITDVSPFDATDGIWFQNDDGDDNIDFHVRQDATTGATSVSDIASVVAAEFLELAFFWDGTDRVYYGVDGTVLGYVTATDADFLPNTELTVSFALLAGTTAAETMSVDYVFCAKER